MTHFIEPMHESVCVDRSSKTSIANPSVNLGMVSAVERHSSGEFHCIRFYGISSIAWTYQSAHDRDADWQRILRGE